MNINHLTLNMMTRPVYLMLMGVFCLHACGLGTAPSSDTGTSSDTSESSFTAKEEGDLQQHVEEASVEEVPEKISYQEDFKAPNGIEFEITTYGEDSLRNLKIVAVKDEILLTEIEEKVTGRMYIVRITDMNQNNDPELLIFTRTEDEGKYWHFYAYEFAENDWTKVYFPPLDPEQARGYKGRDLYRRIGNDMLRRTFPVFRPDDEASPSGGECVIEYKLNEQSEMYVDTVKTSNQ